MRRDDDRETDTPALYAFGTRPLRILTAEEEVGAPFADRLRSSWRYLVARCRRFAATLSPRERASYDPEDLIQEVVVDLLRNDHLWDPARGRYCTFADRVTRSVFASRRERARTVKAPANALSTIRKCSNDRKAGTLTAARAETEAAIRLLFREPLPCPPQSLAPEPREDHGVVPPSHDLIEGLKRLSNPLHALVLARTHGLFGQPQLNADELAADLAVEPKRARSLQTAARDSLKQRIQKLRESRP